MYSGFSYAQCLKRDGHEFPEPKGTNKEILKALLDFVCSYTVDKPKVVIKNNNLYVVCNIHQLVKSSIPKDHEFVVDHDLDMFGAKLCEDSHLNDPLFAKDLCQLIAEKINCGNCSMVDTKVEKNRFQEYGVKEIKTTTTLRAYWEF